MSETIDLGGITAELIKKNIKNIHLSVNPPNGRIRISAPLRMNTETVRVFAISRLDWIKRQQRRFLEQERETPREYIDRESHYVWGRRYLMKVIEADSPPRVELDHSTIILRVRTGADDEIKKATLAEWYREQLKETVRPLIARWEQLMGVKVERLFVQVMKTKWGSCNHAAGTIRLNSELAKKPRECLEYVLVHEMTHLLEPTHNHRFVDSMDLFMPKWRYYRDLLSRLPARHENWVY